ncbi:MAG: glycosyltransferase family 2 protein [Candidatus Altiarchaeota archaeon]
MHRVSVVIPALNEEGSVGGTVRSVPKDALKRVGFDVEILVVDNGSSDSTASEAEKAGARVVSEDKRGYGNAYISGFSSARGDILVMADADGTYPLETLPDFIRPIADGRADFVIGSRMKGSIEPGAMPWLHRHVGNPILTFFLNRLFGTNISDSHCGMRAFTRAALDKMNLKTGGMEFASEMLIEAARNKLRMVEVPISYRARSCGKPKLSSFSDGWRHLRFMMLYNPTSFFIIPGALLFLAGFALVVVLVAGPVELSFGGDNFLVDIHPMVLGNLLVVLGLQIIILGIFTRVYSVIMGLKEPGRFSKALLKYNSLERELVAGVIIFLSGFAVALRIFLGWINTGFGELSELRNAILASTLMFFGVQLIFSALFLSVLLLGRRESDEDSLHL